MIPAWILLGVVIAVGIVVVAASRLRRDPRLELGTVSNQWIAEQRSHDPHR
jgi:hypothetical protein